MLLSILATLIGIEGAALLAGAVFFFIQIFVQQTTSLTGSIVIFIITLIIGVGVLAAALGTVQRKTWVRGPILTWQILQIPVAISFFQGTDFWPLIGWALMILSLIVSVLLIWNVLIRVRQEESALRGGTDYRISD